MSSFFCFSIPHIISHQLPGMVPSLHLEHGLLSVATSRQEEEGRSHLVCLYDTSHGNLQEIGVSGRSLCWTCPSLVLLPE